MIDSAGLRVMKAIAQEGSFTAAAASLGYSQPAVSQMVRRLEDKTGTALVERLGRSVRLTEAGHVLARTATPVLAALEAAEGEVASIAGLRAGRVRLMAFPSASSTVVPRALSLVKQRYPDVQVTFAEAEPPESLAALRAGDCDVAVAFSYDGDEIAAHAEDLEGLTTLDLLEDEVRLAVPADHPFAGRGSVSMEELESASWIAGCPRCRGHLLSLATSAGYTPDVAFETEDYVTVLGLVAEGLGVALIPELILRSTQHPRVATIAIEPASRRSVQAVTTPDLQRVPAVKATLDALREATDALPNL
ncbi:LysR family transcriptional regulator [Dermacoccus abyssi]|jgi:molybdate transport repressor ModE-like protein|uniref:LysR family transcriptional regulator n=1 Tax=Dermacoccus abyssi TaxID=322596 RepID=UPI0021A5AF9B|nr:LysR family transcriptional regulator [Dermacoccus abyssi]MCT1985652.1 LysR family transcriptional regulator [Dermacoccus abyssi]